MFLLMLRPLVYSQLLMATTSGTELLVTLDFVSKHMPALI